MKIKLGVLFLVGYVSLYGYIHLGSDLLAPWYGSRVLLHRQNPYSPEVTQQIQLLHYGRPVLRGDEQRFAYPAYASLLLLPVSIFPFRTAQLLMTILLVASTCVLARLSISMVKATNSVDLALSGWAITILTVISPPVLCGLLLQQVALLVECLIIAALWLVTKRKYWAAGFLLALATSKPQLALIPVIWLTVWGLGRWRERWKLIVSFGMASLLLAIYGAFFVGLGWLSEWIKGLLAYREYAYAGVSVLELISGRRIGPIITALAFLGLLLYMITRREEKPNSVGFLQVSFFLLALSLVLVPALLSLYNYVLLLPGILLLSARTTKPPDSGRPSMSHSEEESYARSL